MKSIPYIIVDADQGNQVQEEIEMASVLLIAMSRQKNNHPDAIVKVNYPFRLYELEGESMVFDLLGLSRTEKNWLLPDDISDILTELETTEDSHGILGLLKKGIDALDREPYYGSIWIKGMIGQEDVKAYFLKSIQRNNLNKEKLDRFMPILTKGKFSSIRKKLGSVQKEIDGYIESTVEAKMRFETKYEVIKKTQEKNLSILKKESDKRLEEFNKEKDKAINIIEKSLKKEVATINDEFKERRTFITNEINAAYDEMGKLKKMIETGAAGDEKRRVANLEKLLNTKKKEIKILEDERLKRLSQAEKMVDSEKQEWENKTLIKSDEEDKLIGELLETHEMNLKGCDDFMKSISNLEVTLIRNKDSLSNILDIKYEKGEDLFLPFYIFKYGEGYGFCPPIKVSEAKDMRKMLKLIIANNLENKIGRYLQPQTEVFDEILKIAVDTIMERTELFDQYQEALSETNLLETRETLDKMVVGLYQIMEWGWISEKDYIEAQRFLVERLDSLNEGTLFQVKEQVMDEPIDSSEAIEIAVSE